jgi:hypothetical protein
MLTKDEKNYLKVLVSRELETFEKEGKTVLITESFPDFLSADKKYDSWLKGIIKKLN